MLESKSQIMKKANADKAKLKGVARDVYLNGVARLSKCEEVARKGNKGKGYIV